VLVADAADADGVKWGERLSVRANRLDELGIWVGSAAPATPITYAEWLAGNAGHWTWIVIP
jgi:hypothetical protein